MDDILRGDESGSAHRERSLALTKDLLELGELHSDQVSDEEFLLIYGRFKIEGDAVASARRIKEAERQEFEGYREEILSRGLIHVGPDMVVRLAIPELQQLKAATSPSKFHRIVDRIERQAKDRYEVIIPAAFGVTATADDPFNVAAIEQAILSRVPIVIPDPIPAPEQGSLFGE